MIVKNELDSPVNLVKLSLIHDMNEYMLIGYCEKNTLIPVRS